MSKQQSGPDAAGARPAGTDTQVGTAPETGARVPAQAGSQPGGASRAGADPEAAVAAYLRAHPDFFERHGEILAIMRVRHESGHAVSLIEHQVSVLRHQLDTERGRLAHLIARARGYESLAARHHDLVVHIIPAADLERLHAVLHDMLLHDFNAEAVALKLFPVDLSEPTAAGQDPLVAAFRDFLCRPHALCGPLDPEQGHFLFGETGAGLGSAVLVPIRAGARCGVLAIGAADPERFGPDMRTDLLDRLGEVLGAKLRSLPSAAAGLPAPQRKPRRVGAKAQGDSAVKPVRPAKPRAKREGAAGAKAGLKPERKPGAKPESGAKPAAKSARKPGPKSAPAGTAGRGSKRKSLAPSVEVPAAATEIETETVGD